MYPAGLFIITGRESLTEMQLIILCLVFLKPLKSQMTEMWSGVAQMIAKPLLDRDYLLNLAAGMY